MVRDANALLARYQDETAQALTRALVAEQALAEANARIEALEKGDEDE